LLLNFLEFRTDSPHVFPRLLKSSHHLV
jgi:hypothetical protein